MREKFKRELTVLKKIFSLLLVLALLLGAVSAVADGTPIDPKENRNITVHPAGDNEVEDGVSPTTGRQLSDINVPSGFLGMAVDGEYRPILIQVDNSDGGTGDRAPWNASYADIIYETPLRSDGETRLTMVYSDVQPDYVGPIRSLRMHSIRLREEWDCPYVFAGMQRLHDTNVDQEITNLGVDRLKYLYDGNANKAWNAFIYRCANFASPHNSIVYLAGSGGTKNGAGGIMQNIYPEDVHPKLRPFKFSDEPMEGGDEAEIIYITHGKGFYDSRLEYDEDEDVYYRYMVGKNEDILYDELSPTFIKRIQRDGRPLDQYDVDGSAVFTATSDGATTTYQLPSLGENPPVKVDRVNVNGRDLYEGMYWKYNAATGVVELTEVPAEGAPIEIEYSTGHGNPITFSNVIIQFTNVHFWAVQKPDPIVTTEDSKYQYNADYFIGGMHYRGVWRRDTLKDRTVFYGEDGEEITLKPGKTLIVMMELDYNTGDYLVHQNGTKGGVSYE